MSEAIVSLFNAICLFRTRCALRSHCLVVSCPTASPPPRLPGPGGEDDGDGHLTAFREGFRSAPLGPIFGFFFLFLTTSWPRDSFLRAWAASVVGAYFGGLFWHNPMAGRLSLSRTVIMAGSCQGKALASKGHPCLNFMVCPLRVRCDGRGQPVCQLGTRPLPPLTAME